MPSAFPLPSPNAEDCTSGEFSQQAFCPKQLDEQVLFGELDTICLDRFKLSKSKLLKSERRSELLDVSIQSG